MAHPDAPPKIPSAKIRWKISRLEFMGSRCHSPHWLFSKGPNYQRFSSLLVQLKDILKEKHRGKSPKGSGSCTTILQLIGHLQSRRNWPTGLPVSWSTTLFSGSAPVALPPVLWTEKTTESSTFFVRRGGHCCRGDLVRRTTSWIFFGLANCTSTFRREPRAEASSCLKEDTLLLHYKFQQVKEIQGDFGCLLWETCGIQKQTVWTKCWVSFVTAVLLSYCINCTSICYPNFNGP